MQQPALVPADPNGPVQTKPPREPSVPHAARLLSAQGGAPHPSEGSPRHGATSASFAGASQPLHLSEFQRAVFALSVSPAGATPAAVQHLMARLSPEAHPQVAALYGRCGTAVEFVERVQFLQLRRRLAVDATVRDFLQAAADEAAPLGGVLANPGASVARLRSVADELGVDARAAAVALLEAHFAATPAPSLGELQAFVVAAKAQLPQPSHAVVCDRHTVATGLAALLEMEDRLGHVPYLETVQPAITARVRCILVDWMCDVAGRYRFAEQTMHIAVGITDRFLGVERITRREVQLVGVAALFLAAKYEEIYPPDVNDLVGMTANSYTKEDILRTERQLFYRLQFRVTMPTTWAMAECLLAEQSPPPAEQQQHMAAFLLEALLHAEVYAAHRTSSAAAAAVFISRLWANVPTARLPSADVLSVVGPILDAAADFAGLARTTSRARAIEAKFASTRYSRVSLLPLPVAVVQQALRSATHPSHAMPPFDAASP